MKVFISWSGLKSRAIAEAIRKWLPSVLQAVTPYFSPDDISKGSRWSNEISKELAASQVGLLIITPENQSSEWIMFEAGALAKNLDNSKVAPLLFGLEPTDINSPLVQFQASKFDRDEMLRVITAINEEVSDHKLSTEVLHKVYNMWWPEIEKEIRNILSQDWKEVGRQRTERDMIEEVLELSRSMVRNQQEVPRPEFSLRGHAAMVDLRTAYTELLTNFGPVVLEPEQRKAIISLHKPVAFLLNRYLPGPDSDHVVNLSKGYTEIYGEITSDIQKRVRATDKK